MGALLLLAVGCKPPGQPNPDDRPETPGQIVNFDVLFRQNCAGCHGADGKLGPAPPLNDPLFLALVTPEDLLHVIHNGRHGTPMPAFARALGGTLTDEQVTVLAEGIPAHWKSKSTPSSEPAAPLPAFALAATDGGASLPGDRERGATLFVQACAGCHGTNGTGEDGTAGAINDPDFLSLISNQALRRIIITGRPDLGMPSYAEDDGRADDFKPLTSEQIDDLVALLAHWRTAPQVASSGTP